MRRGSIAITAVFNSRILLICARSLRAETWEGYTNGYLSHSRSEEGAQSIRFAIQVYVHDMVVTISISWHDFRKLETVRPWRRWKVARSRTSLDSTRLDCP